ncbi:MAG TPA: hypothetical protein VMU55_01725 [Solirubrobacteraceae bacterium]|nr:hypothetical protein [Solirubrobacteraceae bacterium]
MTGREELVQALRECMSALDACLNSSELEAALEEADRVLTTYRLLLQQLAA